MRRAVGDGSSPTKTYDTDTRSAVPSGLAGRQHSEFCLTRRELAAEVTNEFFVVLFGILDGLRPVDPALITGADE